MPLPGRRDEPGPRPELHTRARSTRAGPVAVQGAERGGRRGASRVRRRHVPVLRRRWRPDDVRAHRPSLRGTVHRARPRARGGARQPDVPVRSHTVPLDRAVHSCEQRAVRKVVRVPPDERHGRRAAAGDAVQRPSAERRARADGRGIRVEPPIRRDIAGGHRSKG